MRIQLSFPDYIRIVELKGTAKPAQAAIDFTIHAVLLVAESVGHARMCEGWGFSRLGVTALGGHWGHVWTYPALA